MLAVFTATRLALAAWMPLAPDEAYYWTWSRALAPGYFDHPPMIALWIRAGTWLAGDSPFGIRLFAPLAAALGSVLLWDAAERLFPGRSAGPVAVWLLNATLLIGVGSVIMTPDSPLLLFWTAGLWAMARIVTAGSGAWWLAVGLFIGLAGVSKYTAALLALGITMWLATAGRGWLRRPAPYAAAALALALFAPVLWWNATHGWVSFLRQGVRLGVWSPDGAPRFLLELVGAQAALATPLIFVLCGGGVAAAARTAWRHRDPVALLLSFLALMPAAVFVQHAFGDRVQANWPAICYPAAVIAAAGMGAPSWRRLRIPAIALGLSMTAIVYVQAAFAPLPLPPGLDPIARQLDGWRGLAARVEEARRRVAAGFVAADQSGVAAELARDLPPTVPVIGVGPRWQSFRLAKPADKGMTGILVEEVDHSTTIWPAVAEIGTAAREQGGVVLQSYRLYRVVPDHSTSAVLLPHPGAASPGRAPAGGDGADRLLGGGR